MKNKTIYIISIICFVTGVFLFSYGFAMKKYSLNNNQNKSKGNQVNLATETNSTVDNIIPLNAKIKFNTVNTANEKVFEFEVSGDKLAGKTKKDLEKQYCSGWYKLNSVTGNEIVLVRNEPKFEKNKFVLGIKDGELAIFNSDDTGKVKLFQKSQIKIQSIAEMKGNEEYIRKLVNGEHVFNTAEEAEESLGDFE